MANGNKCEACGMDFKSQQELMAHNSKEHTGSFCKACGIGFKTSEELKAHMQKTHKM